jgi:hypothetical protein
MLTVTCEGCGHTGKPNEEAFFQMITGWRRMFPTTQTIHAKHAEQRFACRSCVDAFEKAGTTWQQESLFGQSP